MEKILKTALAQVPDHVRHDSEKEKPPVCDEQIGGWLRRGCLGALVGTQKVFHSLYVFNNQSHELFFVFFVPESNASKAGARPLVYPSF